MVQYVRFMHHFLKSSVIIDSRRTTRLIVPFPPFLSGKVTYAYRRTRTRTLSRYPADRSMVQNHPIRLREDPLPACSRGGMRYASGNPRSRKQSALNGPRRDRRAVAPYIKGIRIASRGSVPRSSLCGRFRRNGRYTPGSLSEELDN